MAQYIRQRDLHKDTPPMTVIQHMATDAELQHVPWGEYKNVSLKEEHLSSDEDDDEEEQTSPGWNSPGQPQMMHPQQQQQQPIQQQQQQQQQPQQQQIHGQLPHMMQPAQQQMQHQQPIQQQPPQQPMRHVPPPPQPTATSTTTSTSTTTTTTTYKTKHQRNIPGVAPSTSGVELTAEAMAYLRELFLSSEKELLVEVHHVTHIHNHNHNLTVNEPSSIPSSSVNATPAITPQAPMIQNDISDQYSYQQFFTQPQQQQQQPQGNMHEIHEHDIDGAMAMLYGEDFGLELDEGPKRLPGGHPFRGLPFAPS